MGQSLSSSKDTSKSTPPPNDNIVPVDDNIFPVDQVDKDEEMAVYQSDQLTKAVPLDGGSVETDSSDSKNKGIPLDGGSVETDSSDSKNKGIPLDGSLVETGSSDSKNKVSLEFQWKTCADIPIRTKCSQGVLLGSDLYIGGGYVNNYETEEIVYKYSKVFNSWKVLPPCPMKMFGITVFNTQLVLVGGKMVGNYSPKFTNKIVTWDEVNQLWKFSIPPMQFARASPVVISHGHHLIVAGGKSGYLDYNMEIFDDCTEKWTIGCLLPTKCFPQTSVTIGNTWFLLSECHYSPVCADIPLLIEQSVSDHSSQIEQPSSDTTKDVSKSYSRVHQQNSYSSANKASLWKLLPYPPPLKPDVVTTISDSLCVISHEENSIKVHAHLYDMESKLWTHTNKLPNMCSNSTATADNENKGFFLFGGDGSVGMYSKKLYWVSLKEIDASRVVQNVKRTLTFHISKS